ncbi:hypothetical protein Tco_1468539 [Tanacetum coccineum]
MYGDRPGRRLIKPLQLLQVKVSKRQLRWLNQERRNAQGLETLLEIALSEAEQMKIVTKRNKTQFHSSHASGSGADEGTGVSPRVLDVPKYGSEDEHISWKFSNEDDDDEVNMSEDDDDQDDDNADNEDVADQDDDNEQTESDNDGDNFVHPKFSTLDEEERQDEKDKEEEGSDLKVQTPSHYESTDDEEINEVTKGGNVEGEELDEEETNKDEEVNKLYRDVNVNLEGRDTKMTDALQTNVQGTQVIEDTHVIITVVTLEVQQQSSSVSSGFISNMLNPNPDTGIDSILNLNTESTSLVDVPITTNAEMPLSFVTTLPPPPIPFFQPLQQTPVSTTTIVLKFKQTNPFAKAVSLILGIIDKYIANQMNKAVKVAVQLQSKSKYKEQVSKILPRIKKSVNEQLEAEVLTRSSNEAKTSHAIAANLSELELKKILIDKIENNKPILKHMEILSCLKDVEMMRIKTKNPPLDQTEGPRKEELEKNPSQLSTDKSAQADEPIHTVEDVEEPTHQEFITGFTEDQHVDDTTQHPDWFQKPAKPPTPDRDWNKTLLAAHGPIQPWISNLAWKVDPRELFNELMDTPLDFLAFVLNRLKVDTLNPELLVGPTFELMKGSCKSLVEHEYFLEEVCKATTDQLDWNNPEGQQYPHDLRKPLPLIPNSRGRQVIPFDYFINNDLAYLSGGVSSRTYATLVTKIKDIDNGHIKWIKDLVPNTMWSQVPIIYDKHAVWGISHWGRKRQQFFGFTVNRESAHDVYSRNRIIVIKKLTIVEWHNYKHLEWITIHRDDDKFFGCIIAKVYNKHGYQKACRRSSIGDQKLSKEAIHEDKFKRSYPSILEGYTNARWINNTEDISSTNGWVFLLGGGTISWASKKQTCITSSIMESKFVALAAAGKEAEWLRNLILEILLWSKPITPISIRCDNASTLAKAYSQMYNGKSRHLEEEAIGLENKKTVHAEAEAEAKTMIYCLPKSAVAVAESAAVVTRI